MSANVCPVLRPTDFSHVPQYEEFSEKIRADRSTNAEYGVLGKLDGTWVNPEGVYGVHTTPMPSPGTTSEQIFGAFHFKSQEYTEVLTFTKIDGGIRNRLGSNEQFNGTVAYQTAIVDRNGVAQHFENGQYLWLGAADPSANPPVKPNVFLRPATEETVKEDVTFPVLFPGALGPTFAPPHQISRGGVIPHGSTIHLTGGHTYTKITDKPFAIAPRSKGWVPASLAIDPTMGIAKDVSVDLGPADAAHPPAWTKIPVAQSDVRCTEDSRTCKKGEWPADVQDPTSGRAYFAKILTYHQELKSEKTPQPLWPYCVQPSFKLQDALEKLGANAAVKEVDLIELSSTQRTGLAGGIMNNVGVDRYCKAVSMTLKMWLEHCVDEHGEPFEQLQYEQIVMFQFQFGSNGGTTQWPHIQVNTLQRKEHVDKKKAKAAKKC